MDSLNGDSKQIVAAPVANVSSVEPLVAMPLLQQSGKVFVGPGAKKEAQFIGLGLIKLSSRQKDDLERAKKFALEQSIKYVLVKQQQAHQQNQQKIAMYAQAISLMARVYIGSISFEIREEQIKQNFSVFGPIKSINMSWDTVTGHHKGFAFLEYEVPEAALLAQEAMNGKLVGGRNLKVLPVGRPANMPQAQPIIEMVMQEAKDYNRVYVASVHPDLSEQDLRSVFEAFGEITKCQLAKQPGGKGHRGFGYLEFKTAQAVKEAIEGMNNFDLGGQYLQVGRCITPPDALTYVMPSAQSSLPSASAAAAAAVTAKIQAQEVIGGAKGSPNSSNLGNTSPIAMDYGSPSPPTGSSPKDSPKLSAIEPPNVVPPSVQSYSDGIASSAEQGTSSGRRRGFGGFATAVPAPTIVQPLPPPSLVVPSTASPTFGTAPPPPPIPAPVPQPATNIVTYPQNPYLTETTVMTAPPPPPKPKKDILSRIKIKPIDMSQKATFAPLPDIIAPKDKLAGDEAEEYSGDQLMIGGPDGYSSSTALALRDDGNRAVAKTSESKSKSSSGDGGKFRKKKVKPPKAQGPKLSTPQALAAAEKAGALNDQMQAVNAQNEEASLASQENVEIRGNDARHLLMHKLMRTNRSSVIVLKNMVTAEGVDDELEDEIRSECEKFGSVVKVVFAREEDSDDVRIFVRYADPMQADAARSTFDKRFFDGKTISCQIYDQILFEHEDYTG